jgi:hypothetical protein
MITKENKGNDKMKNYFGKNVSPSKDMERHSNNEKYLNEKIAQLESNFDGSKIQVREIESYKYFLRELLKSKAEIASKLFK